MTALSIRHMNHTLALRETLAEDREQSTPSIKRESQHYWHIQRKAKRGNRWIFHCEFFGSKSDVAEFWRKNFQGRSKQYRLRHLLKY